jgi:hypothetical protein
VNEPIEAAPGPGAEPSALSQRALDELTDRVYRLLAADLARQRERRGGGLERWR